MPKVRFGKFSFELPKSRPARIGLGVGLVLAGGLFGFLPVLGYWMVPVGLVVLATDSPPIRRFNRRTAVKVVGWWKGRRAKAKPKSGATVNSVPPSSGER